MSLGAGIREGTKARGWYGLAGIRETRYACKIYNMMGMMLLVPVFPYQEVQEQVERNKTSEEELSRLRERNEVRHRLLPLTVPCPLTIMMWADNTCCSTSGHPGLLHSTN